MSNLATSIGRLQRKIDPIGFRVGEAIGLTSIKKQERMDAEANTKDAIVRAAHDEKLSAVNREMSVATREQNRRQSAAAAGATRSGNEADLLGYVAGGAKRKSASRTILG